MDSVVKHGQCVICKTQAIDPEENEHLSFSKFGDTDYCSVSCIVRAKNANEVCIRIRIVEIQYDILTVVLYSPLLMLYTQIKVPTQKKTKSQAK